MIFPLHQMPRIFVINQVACVSSCWGQKTHTRGLLRNEETPYQPLSQSTGTNKYQQFTHTSHYTSRPVEPRFFKKTAMIDLTICKNIFQTRLCRSQFLERRPHCPSEKLLRNAAPKSSQLVDRRAETRNENFTALAHPLLLWPPVEKCIHCLSIRNTYQFYVQQPLWRWFQGCIKSLALFQSNGCTCIHKRDILISFLPISLATMVTPSGLRVFAISLRRPRGSSIEVQSRDPNICLMRKLIVT